MAAASDSNYKDSGKVTDFNTVICLDDILSGDNDALELLHDCLGDRGWCKVEYPYYIKTFIKEISPKIYKWLNYSSFSDKYKHSSNYFHDKKNCKDEDVKVGENDKDSLIFKVILGILTFQNLKKVFVC